MLIEFRVENYRSLCGEQVLTFEAGALGDELDVRPRRVAGHGKPLLSAAVLYGANASGKSNVLAALGFMREAVVESHRLWEPDGGVPRVPFAWGERRNEPSLFEVSFLAGETKFAYGFVVSDRAVEEEWLYAWPGYRKQSWFEREGNATFKFGEHFKGSNDLIRNVTRPNALFLSVASQHQHKQIAPVYSFFRDIAPLNVRDGQHAPERLFAADAGPSTQQTVLADEDAIVPSIRQLMKAADTGIVDVKIIRENEESAQRSHARTRVLLQHRADDENSWLDLIEESHGTQILFRMAAPIFRTLASGGVLLVDELESSLHPVLGQAIVELFNHPTTNPKNAQIIFTTHDTNLLGTTFGEPPLRRDQIWFTEKDQDGATTLYPLTDYKPRKVENLERGYLQGRYGAVPVPGNFILSAEQLHG